jgi:NAD(P)-dependent dehydrogenase (short-subunit alcohol dehydrogenase family)
MMFTDNTVFAAWLFCGASSRKQRVLLRYHGQRTAAIEPVDVVLRFCRSKERVARTVESICRAAGKGSSSSSSIVQGYVADLSRLEDVRQLAAAVQADHPRLYALVNNAGVYETQKK